MKSFAVSRKLHTFAHAIKKCTNNQYRGVEQLVARQAHNLEVACSSPASATNNDITSCKNNELCRFFGFRVRQNRDKIGRLLLGVPEISLKSIKNQQIMRLLTKNVRKSSYETKKMSTFAKDGI